MSGNIHPARISPPRGNGRKPSRTKCCSSWPAGVGFLANKGVAALCGLDGYLLFVHADLSGLSLFEEAAWSGESAARKLLG